MTPPSFYLAAPYQMRAAAQVAMQQFAARGFACTARWITQDDSAQIGPEWAQADLADIDAAAAFVALGPEVWKNAGSGGRHVELGYALARGKLICLVGARTNLFHHHPAVTWCATVDDAIDWLAGEPSWPR